MILLSSFNLFLLVGRTETGNIFGYKLLELKWNLGLLSTEKDM